MSSGGDSDKNRTKDSPETRRGWADYADRGRSEPAGPMRVINPPLARDQRKVRRK